MNFKKVIIDGKEMFVKLDDEIKEVVNNVNQTTNLFRMNNKIVAMLPFLDQKEIKELANKMEESEDGTFKGVRIEVLLPFLNKEDVNEIFIKHVQKRKSFASIAPFVDSSALAEVVDQFINGDLDINITSLIPFLEETEINRLFTIVSESENLQFKGLQISQIIYMLKQEIVDEYFEKQMSVGKTIVSIVPFVSDKCLHRITEMYINGEANIDIDTLYPFLNDEDIKAIFNYELTKDD